MLNTLQRVASAVHKFRISRLQILKIFVIFGLWIYHVRAQGIQIVTVSQPSFIRPAGLTLDPGQNLYVADQGNQRIVKLSPHGDFLTSFPGPARKFINPSSIKLDSAMNIYVADVATNRVVKMDPSGATLNEFYNAVPILHPGGLGLDSNGNIYTTDTVATDASIVKLAPNGTFLETLTTSDPVLSNPNGLAIDFDNNVYVADTSNARVVKLDSNGTQLMVLYPTYVSGVSALALDSAENIYVAGYGTQVYKIAPNGTMLTSYTIANVSVNLQGLAVNPVNSNIYVALSDDNLGDLVQILHFEPCPLGYYCDTSVSEAQLCPEGFYCPEQYAYGPQILKCPAGQSCPPGTVSISSSSSTGGNSASSSRPSEISSSWTDWNVSSSTAGSTKTNSGHSSSLITRPQQIIIGVIVPVGLLAILGQ